MVCARCQHELPEAANFCPACGASHHGQNALPWSARRLTRSPGDAKIAGVCSGLASYFGIDVTFVRVAWVVLSIVPGAVVGGVVAYLLAWLLMPEGAPVAAVTVGSSTRLTRSATDRKIAGVCGGVGEYFGVDSTALRLLWIVLSVLPGAIVGGVVLYLVAWLIIPASPPADLVTTTSQASPAA